MEIAPLSHLKKELKTYPQEELVKVCLRLAKHKKEVKELLHYLVFEAQDEQSYISVIKEVTEEAFAEVPTFSMYRAKNNIRKILRNLNKYIRFSGLKETEAELRIHFCQQLLELGLDLPRSTVLLNLYKRQVGAIEKAIDKLHPDLQFDFEADFQALTAVIDYP